MKSAIKQHELDREEKKYGKSSSHHGQKTHFVHEKRLNGPSKNLDL